MPRLIVALFLLALIGPLQAAETAPSAAVEVRFENPEGFADARTDGSGRRGASAEVTEGLGRYLARTAPRYLRPGSRLEIVFTDIDLAGEPELGGDPALHGVRVVRSIHPPRLRFRWRVLDRDGALLGEGEEDLRDLGFQAAPHADRDDALRYEKRMLRDWLRERFGDRQE
ncbi:MAG: hypothetical protein KatS3mg126_1369 [Lysobacteraceae bacterium]|nr:MAG: hypothetical protein KatS3mg126_1369 [Xanthomonadaceae bacterium]